MAFLFAVITAVSVISLTLTLVGCDYWSSRAEFIKKEESRALGALQILNERETQANAILMQLKLKEYDEGIRHPEKFAASQHFFKSKKLIEQSEVFKIIRQLPKGAVLHGHDTSLTSFDFRYNLTFMDNLYACVADGNLKLKFGSYKIPNVTCDWKLVEDLRKHTNIDSLIKEALTLVVDDPRNVYTNINEVWNKFLNIFGTITPMLSHKPIWKLGFYEALKELYEDNIMYIELRSTLPELYDLDGTTYGPEETVAVYKETLQLFMEDHPDFQGAKIIYAPRRQVQNATMEGYVAMMKKLKKLYPHFVVGFDLVGQEDAGGALVKYINELEELQKMGTKFFFHAGETNWYDSSTDFNLVDAVLLGTKRIGHGYALAKHPEVLRVVKELGIAVEICPISNQVLLLLEDLRNHPGSYYIANGYPVVISSDDPGFWGAKGLSYDWYMAFMAMAGRDADLRFLKQLALNSFYYSALEPEEKQNAINQWQIKWDKFIRDILSKNNVTDKENIVSNRILS